MPPETDNLKLEDLFNADQRERGQVLASAAEVEALKQSDAARRRELAEMMGRGEVNTAVDLYRAGVIFLHGAQPKDFLTAHRLATMSALLGHRGSRWLLAAALDRFLMSNGLPQVYGTQFERNEEENRYQLRLPIDDTTVLHFEKRFFDVPSVIERLSQLNRRVAG